MVGRFLLDWRTQQALEYKNKNRQFTKEEIFKDNSKSLDTGDILKLSNLQNLWTIVCKDVDRTFDLEYSTYCILNRLELCECSLTVGNYLLSQPASNCGGTPEVKDGFFTTNSSFNKIVLAGEVQYAD